MKKMPNRNFDYPRYNKQLSNESGKTKAIQNCKQIVNTEDARMKKSLPLRINHLQYNSPLLELQNVVKKISAWK